MKFKVGDKVKFLNEPGGGIVSRIISPGMVNVAIEDGFEIPTMTGDLIRIEEDAPVDSPKHMFREDYNVQIDDISAEHFEPDDAQVRLTGNPSRGRVEPGIYLAFIPHDQKWLITGMLDIYLVNHTDWEILYSIFIQTEKDLYEGADYGSVQPASMMLLHTIERDDLHQWEKGIVQILYHTDQTGRIISPGHSEFRIRMSRFYQENSYRDSEIIDGKAILVSLLPLAGASAITGSAEISGKSPEATVTRATEAEPRHMIDKHRTSPKEAVVDLHIYELVENDEELKDAEKLSAQIAYFKGCLESAIVNRLTKVTFIHGVGSGVLKKEILTILKDYPVEVRDASMNQYGYGATEVTLRYQGSK